MKYFSVVLIVIVFKGFGQNLNTEQLIQLCDSVYTAGHAEKTFPGGQLVVVKGDSVFINKGYGVSDVERNLPVNPNSTIFQMGSTPKLFTAVAALQLVEKGLLDLNEDVNKYLDEWQLENPYNTPITLSHLLTHSAGFNDRAIGYIFKSERDVEGLEEHLKRRMPSLFQKPGTEINYSNYSYALIGLLIEKQSGLKFEDYIWKNILDPLGMEGTTYRLPDDYRSMNEYAKGYRNTDEGFVEVTSYPRSATPAGSAISSGTDMGKFLKLLLGKSDLLSESSRALLYQTKFTNDSLLSGYSYGMEVQRYNGHTFYAKGGDTPGFNTHLLVFPEIELGVYMTVNTQTDNFMTNLNRQIKELLYPEKPGAMTNREDPNLSLYPGQYRFSRYNHETVEDILALFAYGAITISASDSTDLEAYIQRKYRYYESKGEGVFVDKGDPNSVLVFEERDGEMHLFYSYMVHGMDVPASLIKIPWYETPKFIDSGYPTIWLPIMVYPLMIIWLVIVWLVRYRKKDFLEGKLLTGRYHIPLILFTTFTIGDLILFFMPLVKKGQDILFGLPEGLENVKYFHMVMILISVTLVVHAFKVWRLNRGTLVSRVYYTLFTLSSIHYIYFLHRWHFITMAN